MNLVGSYQRFILNPLGGELSSEFPFFKSGLILLSKRAVRNSGRNLKLIFEVFHYLPFVD